MIDGLFDNPVAFLAKVILMAPALLLAVTVHEVAHGWVADRLGDPTARMLGRLTLNPLPHIDPFGALAFVLAGFGWAKPVPVNARNLRHPRRDMALVAAAGPLSNFLLAFVGLVALQLVVRADMPAFFGEPLIGILRYVYVFNLGLAIFNLIPLPPLDGSWVLSSLVPSLRRFFESIAPFGFLILIVLSGTRILGLVMGPPLAFLFGVVERVLGLR
jgi:Zn-dependent protease